MGAAVCAGGQAARQQPAWAAKQPLPASSKGAGEPLQLLGDKQEPASSHGGHQEDEGGLIGTSIYDTITGSLRKEVRQAMLLVAWHLQLPSTRLHVICISLLHVAHLHKRCDRCVQQCTAPLMQMTWRLTATLPPHRSASTAAAAAAPAPQHSRWRSTACLRPPAAPPAAAAPAHMTAAAAAPPQQPAAGGTAARSAP